MESAPKNEINDLLKIDGNNKCVDCQADNPTFASINNGAFVCETCATFHRALGPRRSLIKSLITDQLTPEDIALLKIGGNTRFLNFVAEYGIQSEKKDFKYQLQFCEYYRSLLLAEVNKEKNPEEYEKILKEKPTPEVGHQLIRRQSEFGKDISDIGSKIGAFFSSISQKVNETARNYGISQKFDEAREKFNEGVKTFGENHPSLKNAATKTGEAFTAARNYTAETLNKVIESDTMKNITGTVNNKYNEVVNSETMNKISQTYEDQYVNLKTKAGYKKNENANNNDSNNNINNENNVPLEENNINNINNEEPKKEN